jgi:hypothetical protein
MITPTANAIIYLMSSLYPGSVQYLILILIKNIYGTVLEYFKYFDIDISVFSIFSILSIFSIFSI